MTAERLDEILGLMLDLGLAHLSFSDGRGSVSMRLVPAPESNLTREQIPDGEAAPEILSTVSMGRLAFSHPTRPHESYAEGSLVRAGETVAYVTTGVVVTPVIADRPGVLGRRLREEGDVVGYGTPVFEFTADE